MFFSSNRRMNLDTKRQVATKVPLFDLFYRNYLTEHAGEPIYLLPISQKDIGAADTFRVSRSVFMTKPIKMLAYFNLTLPSSGRLRVPLV